MVMGVGYRRMFAEYVYDDLMTGERLIKNALIRLMNCVWIK